jgi:hydroxymethylpyrimidine pyrophosphatase-like HAD family hydrolase
VSTEAAHLVLATDLDGTFLEGPSQQRSQLYRWIERHRARLTLVFLTGRGLEECAPLYTDEALPRPDWLVCDVGASIFHGATRRPLAPLDDELARAWPGPAAVREKLSLYAPFPESPQPARHRLTYLTQGAPVPAALLAAIAAAGWECSTYGGQYLDVLPGGVNKGSTLLRLLSLLGRRREEVLVCGDSLNDLTLFETGLRGVAVGNASPELLARIAHLPSVHRSAAPGAAGILDALERLGHLESSLRVG